MSNYFKVTSESTIYVVMGQTGEYSDYSQWPVKAFKILEKAQEFITAVTKIANKVEAAREDN